MKQGGNSTQKLCQREVILILFGGKKHVGAEKKSKVG